MSLFRKQSVRRVALLHTLKISLMSGLMKDSGFSFCFRIQSLVMSQVRWRLSIPVHWWKTGRPRGRTSAPVVSHMQTDWKSLRDLQGSPSPPVLPCATGFCVTSMRVPYALNTVRMWLSTIHLDTFLCGFLPLRKVSKYRLNTIGKAKIKLKYQTTSYISA